MKRITPLVFICMLITPALFAQKQKKKDGSNFHWISEQIVVGACGGQFHPDLYAMNDQLTKWGAKVNFYEGLRAYGLTYAGPVNITHGLEFDGSSSLGLFVPADVTIGKNDSLKFRMRGWHLMTSAFGKDIIPGSTVALVLAPGIDWGMLKMTRTLNGEGGLYKNPFIAPMGRAEMRFVFGPIALGARTCYRYEVTKDTWNQKKGPAFALPGTLNTGWSVEFFVGWGYAHFQ